jgi:hypothetical protein
MLGVLAAQNLRIRPMRRIILLGGMLLVAAGMTALVFTVRKPVAVQHLDFVGAAEQIDPAPLGKPPQNSAAPLSTPWQFNKPWQDLRDAKALP